MKPRDRKILRQFAGKVREFLPDAEIRAFGSRARGDAHPGSDFDICIVSDALEDKELRSKVRLAAWEVGFEHEIMITTVEFNRYMFDEGMWSESDIVEAIKEEGVEG